MEGTYPLPEAQLDRFFFKLIVPFPTAEDLTEIIRRTTARGCRRQRRRWPTARRSSEMRQLARQVPIAGHVTDYAVRLVLATHPEGEATRRRSSHTLRPLRRQPARRAGARPRRQDPRPPRRPLNVAFDDVRAVAAPALRHRLILNFEAEADGVTADDVLTQAAGCHSGIKAPW